MEEEKTSFLIKDIPRDIWDKFKNKIPRTITLNDAILELLKRESEDELQQQN